MSPLSMSAAVSTVESAVQSAVVVAQLNPSSGIPVRDIALAIIGTFAIVVLAARALGAFADERYGKMITLVLAAIPVIGFSYFPDATVNILKGLFNSFTS
jgi:hypothetical protein